MVSFAFIQCLLSSMDLLSFLEKGINMYSRTLTSHDNVLDSTSGKILIQHQGKCWALGLATKIVALQIFVAAIEVAAAGLSAVITDPTASVALRFQ